MSHCSVCLREVSRALQKHEETCSTPIPTLEEFMKAFFSLQRSHEALTREVKALKRARNLPNEPEEEGVPCDFPEIDFEDLMEFLKSKNMISVVILRHNWPIKAKGKSLVVYEAGKWVLVTDEKLYEITKRIRCQLNFHLNELNKRDNMDKDVNSPLPEYSFKVAEISEADVKRAFLGK